MQTKSAKRHSRTGASSVQQRAPRTIAAQPRLSLVMIVKDEEDFLENCLASVRGIVDEIIVVDTGSSDRSIEIAAGFGATIRRFVWRNDFAAARNYALAQATGDWILHLDADEELDPSAAPKLRELLIPVPDEPVSYLVTVRNLNTTETKYTKDLSLQRRLFARHPRLGYVRPIHEQLVDMQSGSSPRDIERPDIIINHYGYIADVMRRRGKRGRNLAALRAALAGDPSDPANHFDLGRFLYAAGETTEALVHLRDAVRADAAQPRRPDVVGMAYALAALCHLRLSQPDEAVALAQEGFQATPTAYNRFVLGQTLMAAARLDEAIEKLTEALRAVTQVGESAIGFSVTRREILAGLGQAHQRRGDSEAALRCYRELLDCEPRTAELHYAIGHLCVNLGHYAEGADNLRSYLAIVEDDGRHRIPDGDLSFAKDELTTRALAYVLLSRVALAQGVPQLALGHVEKALLLAPRLLEANLQMTEALRSLGQMSRVRDIFGFLLREHPENTELWIKGAEFLESIGDPDAALAVLSEAMDRGIHDSRLYQYLGVILANLGRYRDSANAFELAIRYLQQPQAILAQ